MDKDCECEACNDRAAVLAHGKTVCRIPNCLLCDEWFRIQPPHYNERMNDEKKRGPGRPPLPPGEKPSEGQPRIEFRIPREVHSWIESQAGPMGVNLWVRKLLETAYENR